MKDRRCIFRAVCGSVIGVIDEPLSLDPNVPLNDQRIVRIGVRGRVVQPRRSIEKDIEKVAEALKDFIGSDSLKRHRRRGRAIDCDC